jgi:hypothetical protein
MFIDAVLSTNYGDRNEDVVVSLNERVRRSFTANMEFYVRMADMYEKSGDTAMASLNRMKAQAYQKIMPN